jgi:hypothetical protein
VIKKRAERWPSKFFVTEIANDKETRINVGMLPGIPRMYGELGENCKDRQARRLADEQLER